MCVLKKMLFAQAPLLAIAMAIFSFFRIYGTSIDRCHKSWPALMALDQSGALYRPLVLSGFNTEGDFHSNCPPSGATSWIKPLRPRGINFIYR